ncbi:transcription elongation factor GreA [Candidatus Microgenomates bacterium]|nr:transcription elongation factor GreA [Candidatus Microgenomates bacterium]
MNGTSPLIITKEGLEKLKAEHDDLLNVKRPEAVVRVAKAREMGDLSENAEYSAARDELSFIDGRIAELEDLLKEVKTVAGSNGKNGKVDIGCKVTVHVAGKKDVFTLVGEWEANPLEKKISHASPLGQALMGKKKGDAVEVEAPAGKIIYTIVSIE